MDHINRLIIPTSDGSHTISMPESGVTYHSTHGAVQESMHVFLRTGLEKALEVFEEGDIHIFEMGFGTGLNAYLTAIAARQYQRKIHYTAVELYPLSSDEAMKLNYAATAEEQQLFQHIHAAAWDTDVIISDHFTLKKIRQNLLSASLPGQFHLVYYDAFAPGHQPELWTEAVFRQLYTALVPGGILATYCSKSDVRRAMQAVGFTVEKLAGPPGKREILRAVKAGVEQ